MAKEPHDQDVPHSEIARAHRAPPEKSDHLTVEDAKVVFARHPNRRNLEALIYVDGAATWIGECDESDGVEWRPCTCDENHSGTSCGWVLAIKSGWALSRLCPAPS